MVLPCICRHSISFAFVLLWWFNPSCSSASCRHSHCFQPKPKTQPYTGYSEEINSTLAITAWLPTHLIHLGLVTILQTQLLYLKMKDPMRHPNELVTYKLAAAITTTTMQWCQQSLHLCPTTVLHGATSSVSSLFTSLALAGEMTWQAPVYASHGIFLHMNSCQAWAFPLLKVPARWAVSPVSPGTMSVSNSVTLIRE